MKRLMNRRPNRASKIFLGLLPFIIILLVYASASSQRLAENADDKLLPSFSSMADAINRMAFQEDKRTGQYLFWTDTWSSLKRLLTAVFFAAVIALSLGILLGVIPYLHANFSPLITVISLIPPMAILPILFIVFGLGELSKVVLIGIGITPFITRDLLARVLEIPQEQLIKAQTLGANTWLVITRIVFPQVCPRLIDALRLSLGAAWLFLIASEAIAADGGLGYRIFLVRRYLAMDVIIPYVVWVTFLAFMTDYLLRKFSKFAFPWYYQASNKA